MVRESCSAPFCAGTMTLSHRQQISGGNIDLQKWVEVGGCGSGECLELDAGSNWQLAEWDKERHNMWSLGFIENQMHCRILNRLRRFDCGWKSITVVQSSELWQMSCAACLNRRGSNLKKCKFYLRICKFCVIIYGICTSSWERMCFSIKIITRIIFWCTFWQVSHPHFAYFSPFICQFLHVVCGNERVCAFAD